MASEATAGVRRRPRNRRAMIINSALVLFHRDGFHGVGMEDIAADNGITAGALYRHFRSKQDLLAEVLQTSITAYTELVDAAAPDGIEAVMRAMAQYAVEHRDRGPLWQQHARDLTDEQAADVRGSLRKLARHFADVLQHERPDLAAPDADLLTWAVFSVLGSTSEHSVALPKPRYEDLLCRLTAAVYRSPRLPAPPSPDTAPEPPRPGLSPASRREALVSMAARLFREKGYDAVTMENIGTAAGIAGPSIYNHFAGKADLLTAVLERGQETLRLGLVQALATAQAPDEALEPVVRSYVSPAMRPESLSGLLFSEIARLPEDRRRTARRLQREYIDEWVRLLPTGQAEGRAGVHAALALVNRLALTPHLHSRPAFEEEVTGLALDVLRAA